jgi:putative transposase
VAVGYDVWDATQVWVRDPEGALLAVAHVDGNKRHYFPRTVVDVARERRETGRLKRLQRHRDEILAEAQGALLTPDSEPLTPEEQAAAQAMRARLLEAPAEPAPTADGRPVFQGEFAERDWGRFCQAHFAELDAAERGMFLRRLESGLFRALVGIDEQAAEQLSRAVG